MGLAFLSDGRMVFLGSATNTSSGNGAMGQGYILPPDGNNAVYIASGLSRTGSLTGVTFTKILDSLNGPAAGVVVVNDTVYVMERFAFYRIKSLAPTGGTALSKNATRMINIPTLDSTFTWNRGPTGHQWVFTPQYYNGRFYGNYSGCIIPGGTSNAPPTSTYAGALLSWAKDSIVPISPVNQGFVKEAGGLRSPNGLGSNGEYMIGSDNQGSFNPGCALRMYRPGQPQVTYGTRQSTTANAGGATGITNTLRNWAEDLPYQPPLIWIPYSPSASTSQPAYLNFGPYKGDWIAGDVNASGMGRLHVDQVDNSGNYQASWHLFSGSSINSAGTTEGKAINRIAVSPDSAIYVGTVLKIGNWPTGNPGPVFRITFKDTSVFEILAVRSRKNVTGDANGVEVFFSQPVNPATVSSSSFTLQQQNFMLGANYGCNTTLCTTKVPQVAGVLLSNDNRKAFITISTPDTSIGASHIGTIGVGFNGLGVWGGPGKQDRTLRVTVNNVTSATGASLMYNVAFMGWHFQANTRFDPANTDLVPSPSAISGRAVGPGASRLASSVSTHTLGGILNVHVDLPGQTTVSLYKLNGGLQQEKTGTGSFEFDTRSIGGGLHILRVQQGAAVYSRTVMF
ncbi:MAG TPA: hypothetical protein DCQ83_05775 [Fibrobacteres bacterium]|nr:hypothetical protein [Fibrobacterota bacterium]